MVTPSRVVLLSCGSFNPITNVHLRMFEIARDSLQRNGHFKVIGGIISPVNDKYTKKDLISSYHRCAMIEKSLQSTDWIKLDRWESDLNCWTETRHVLAYHSNRLNSGDNNNIDMPIKKKLRTTSADIDNQNASPILVKLLCGADLLESFAVPNLWRAEHIEEIIGNFGIVCISRAGSDPYRFIYESDVLTKYQNNISIVTEWIHNEVSSTKIRRALQRGESVRYLIQDSVIDYIKKERLYGSVDNKYITTTLLSPDSGVVSSSHSYQEGLIIYPAY